MTRNLRKISISGTIIFSLVLLNGIVLTYGYNYHSNWYWCLVVTLPLFIMGVYHRLQKKRAILRNYPVIGYLRYLLEYFRPELRQYFFETEQNGRPFSRRQRSIVYQRAKNVRQTIAFGMQGNPDEPGYEWVAHSNYPVKVKNEDLRVTIGNSQCAQPYNASLLNIGAMSYGALSRTAIQALNQGAMLGNFAQNTGEGGISPFHQMGGDLIWQIGTGYFGCRNANGNFDKEKFMEKAICPEIKMIELKLSQGAKPGHGGILPAVKNTPEIALIRHVEPHTVVLSPARHTAFMNAEGMLLFLQLLRELSFGKPVGFKLCIGSRKEFHEICFYMRKTGIIPDFITVDGAEGGTGAAPLEFAEHVGMPLFEALAFVSKTLESYGLKNQVRILAAGKIITGFDILKALALGADACYSARGMMFAMGCIQALRCDSGKCPVGVATQEPGLYKGLDVSEKKVRVAHFHNNTLKATKELMEACGFTSLQEINLGSFFRRLNMVETRSLNEVYGFSEHARFEDNQILN